jgi:hypothetical protein
VSEPTLNLSMRTVEGPAPDEDVCQEHTILFPVSHTGGLFHPFKNICPFCRASRLERELAEARRALVWAIINPGFPEPEWFEAAVHAARSMVEKT